MAQTIKIKRSATSGNKLTGSNSVTGELGLNTADKSLYIQTGSTDASVVTIYDDSILHLDDTNNRVGIGVTDPSTFLEIKDSTALSQSAALRINNDNDIGLVAGTFGSTANTFGAYRANSAFVGTSGTATELLLNNPNASGKIRFAVGANGGTEAARFDASGNLLVGRTSSSGTAEGIRLLNDGFGGFHRDGAEVIQVDRKTDDGVLISLRKDGSTVGNIGTKNGSVFIGSTTGSDSYLGFYSNSIIPTTDDGSDRDNAIDLGYTDSRFKDLYLSGKISIDAPSGNTSNVIKASANNTRATLEVTGKTSAGTSVRGIFGSYGDASKIDIGTLSGHATTFLVNNQERARIDTDGKLLVGKTNPSHTVEGGAIFNDGRVYSTTDSSFTFTANRLNSDGEIIRIQKNTSTVGSIVVFDGDNVGFLSGVNNHGGIICGTSSIVPALSGTYSNGATDIGTGTSKWRDIHLSRNLQIDGAVVFDGNSTGLDDYEEGTWTPAPYAPSTVSFSDVVGTYTKIGRMVYAAFAIRLNTNSDTGSFIIQGLPFNIGSTEGHRGGVAQGWQDSGNAYISNGPANTNYFYIYQNSGSAYQFANWSNKWLKTTFIYMTA